MMLSIIVPVFNEEDNIDLLYDAIEKSVLPLNLPWELILVDDGSKDHSLEKMKALVKKNPQRVEAVVLRRNFGQTAALAAGIDQSKGDVIILMDADLQNDPADIPLMVSKINEGYDVVSGWRYNRQDNYITRTLPSKIANGLISWVTGVHLHDYGCTLKAYRGKSLPASACTAKCTASSPSMPGRWAPRSPKSRSITTHANTARPNMGWNAPSK
jgi:glycosyltransferase involved in cell wall biosynthesis